MITRTFRKILENESPKKNIFDNSHEERKIENKIKKKYDDKYKKIIQNGHLILVEVLSFKSIIFEYKNYNDTLPLMAIRKNFLLIAKF